MCCSQPSEITLWRKLYREWAPGEEDFRFPLLPSAHVLPCIGCVCVCVCVREREREREREIGVCRKGIRNIGKGKMMKTLICQTKEFKFYLENHEGMLKKFMHVRSKSRSEFETVNLEDELQMQEGKLNTGITGRCLLQKSEQK